MANNKFLQQDEVKAGSSRPIIVGASVLAFTLLAIGTGIAAKDEPNPDRKQAFEAIKDSTQKSLGDRFTQMSKAAADEGVWHIEYSHGTNTGSIRTGRIRNEKNMTPYELASVVKAVGMDSASLYFSTDKDGDATYSSRKPLMLSITTSKTTTMSKEAKIAVGNKLRELPVIAKQIYATEQCLAIIHQGNLDFKKQFTVAEQAAIVETLRFFGNEIIFSDCPYKMKATEALTIIASQVKGK